MLHNLTRQFALAPGTCPLAIPVTLTVLIVAGLLLSAKSVFAVRVDPLTFKGQEQADPGAPWGIRIIGVRRTAADYMLDFRYRVLDAEKAAYLMDRKIKPQLIVEKNGRKLEVPVSSKIGPLRQSPKFVKANRNYFMFFANPGRSVRAGDRVTVVIGDFEAEHLVVE